ncbi:MAG: hypothetical protein HYZ68_06780 [Chloroflexi bacterium]|nr:hypothetical protein [Chloroflexota bacterium]
MNTIRVGEGSVPEMRVYIDRWNVQAVGKLIHGDLPMLRPIRCRIANSSEDEHASQMRARRRESR